MKLVVDTLPTVPADPPAAGPDRALEEDGAVAELEEVELVLLLPQAARITVSASKSKVTLTNVLSDSDVRFDIFFTSFHVYK